MNVGIMFAPFSLFDLLVVPGLLLCIIRLGFLWNRAQRGDVPLFNP